MNAARDTTTAISQGLYLGFQMSWSSVSAAELIGGIRSAPRSCRGEAGGPVFSRLEHNFHRNFQGNKSMEPCVLGLVHHTHAASAKSFEDAVVRDGLADESVGVRHSAVMLGDELR